MYFSPKSRNVKLRNKGSYEKCQAQNLAEGVPSWEDIQSA